MIILFFTNSSNNLAWTGIRCSLLYNFIISTHYYNQLTILMTSQFRNTNNIKDAVQSVCKQRLCLHFGIQNIEFYSTTIYIFMILEYNKLSRYNNQALQEHKMK